MKRWKTTYNISKCFLIGVCVYIIYLLIKNLIANRIYPYETLGAVIINNSLEAFILELEMTLTVLILPIILDIVLLIVSKKKKNKT